MFVLSIHEICRKKKNKKQYEKIEKIIIPNIVKIIMDEKKHKSSIEQIID